MKTVEQTINVYLKKETGDGLAICPTNDMIQILQKNDSILSCDILSEGSHGKGKKFFHKNPYFSFRKMRKQFKKKTKHFVVADIYALETHFKTFIPDSIYITNGTIYLYVFHSDYDLSLLQKRYQRFHVPCYVESCKDGFMLKIEVGSTKNHYWKDKSYYLIDTIMDIADMIGDALAS